MNLWLIMVVNFLTQANRVCATLRDGVFLLIVKAEPSGDEKDKDFELTCKWNTHVYSIKKTGLGGQQFFCLKLSNNYKMYWSWKSFEETSDKLLVLSIPYKKDSEHQTWFWKKKNYQEAFLCSGFLWYQVTGLVQPDFWLNLVITHNLLRFFSGISSSVDDAMDISVWVHLTKIQTLTRPHLSNAMEACRVLH